MPTPSLAYAYAYAYAYPSIIPFHPSISIQVPSQRRAFFGIDALIIVNHFIVIKV